MRKKKRKYYSRESMQPFTVWIRGWKLTITESGHFAMRMS